MIAQLKSGRKITGKLAETFSRIGIAVAISEKEIAESPKKKEASKPVKKPGKKSGRKPGKKS